MQDNGMLLSKMNAKKKNNETDKNVLNSILKA